MQTIWILIQVKRGFIIEPEIFFSAFQAKNRKEELINDYNKDYDEMEIFKKQVP